MFKDLVCEFVHAIYARHGNIEFAKQCACVKFYLTYDKVTAICGY